ncbi:MAG: hypothetical protein AABW85_00760 [archaeon]
MVAVYKVTGPTNAEEKNTQQICQKNPENQRKSLKIFAELEHAPQTRILAGCKRDKNRKNANYKSVKEHAKNRANFECKAILTQNNLLL